MFLAYLVFTVAYNKKNTVLKFSTKLFGMALYILLFSTAFWILDRQDVLCDPNSLWQGHALWHILNAVVLLFIYLHYRAEKSTISTLNIYEKN